jgi:riboflavin synthase
MFTGLVEKVAVVRRIDRRGTEARLSLGVELRAVELGESIAIDGVCLTVVRITDDGFEADASRETLDVTTLGRLRSGSKVNVERACRANARLGGHLVLGHVDGVGRITRLDPVGDAWLFGVECPEALQRYLAPKGSIAVDGVSLTINRLVAPHAVEIMLVPHTLKSTTLGTRRAGDVINVEVDVLARYVARQLEWARVVPGRARSDAGAQAEDGRMMVALAAGGWLK